MQAGFYFKLTEAGTLIPLAAETSNSPGNGVVCVTGYMGSNPEPGAIVAALYAGAALLQAAIGAGTRVVLAPTTA